MEGVHCGDFKPRDIMFTGANGEYEDSGKLHIMHSNRLITCKYYVGIDKNKQYAENCEVTKNNHFINTGYIHKRNGVFYFLRWSRLYSFTVGSPGTSVTKVLDWNVFPHNGPHSGPTDFAFKSDDEVYVTVLSGYAVYLCTLSTKTCTPF